MPKNRINHDSIPERTNNNQPIYYHGGGNGKH